MSSKKNPKVYMDVQIGASGAGRIKFQLFSDLTPKTVENFRGLCTGEYGKANNVKLHYLNSKFHRIIDGFVIQGGDITHGGGNGGYSIYGRRFADQSFARTHSCAGLLSMANCGRDTNSSQFFITLKPCPHLDGKHVVFGQVIEGMEVVKKIAKVPIDKEDKPRYPIILIDCGEIDDFKEFLKYDPFKKEVYDQLREQKEKIIRDQHLIRKMLSDGVDYNDAYSYKKRLEKCEKDLMQLNKREQVLQHEQQAKLELKENQQQQQPKQEQPQIQQIVLTQKAKQKLGTKNLNRFMDLNLKINEAKALNSKAALEEQIRENDVNYHKMIKKKEYLQKRKYAEQELEAKGIDKEKGYLNRNALKKPKDEEDNHNQSFGWNIYGEEAYYRAYDKRCQTMDKDNELFRTEIEQSQQKAHTDEALLNRLSADITKQQEKRSLLSRRRMYDEDETVNYINERNRIYNQKLERNYGKYASGIKTAMEMNNQR